MTFHSHKIPPSCYFRLVESTGFCYTHYILYPRVRVKQIGLVAVSRMEIPMKKHDDHLFKIGEITKILGVTRKTLLVYENMGLLTPAVRDEHSGYRYYTADNMTQIRSIRSLQALGLTLSEIAEYYYDAGNLDLHLERLMNLRAALDRNIQMLQIRSAKQGDLNVHRVLLPQQICFCRRYQCKDIADASNRLRDTYIATARTGMMSMLARMFTIRMGGDSNDLDLMCCIPVNDTFDGAERREFAETPALCIYYRGQYEGIGTAISALNEYVRLNHVETTGHYRCIYLEGPPSRGENSSDYITQVAVPIKNDGF